MQFSTNRSSRSCFSCCAYCLRTLRGLVVAVLVSGLRRCSGRRRGRCPSATTPRPARRTTTRTSRTPGSRKPATAHAARCGVWRDLTAAACCCCRWFLVAWSILRVGVVGGCVPLRCCCCLLAGPMGVVVVSSCAPFPWAWRVGCWLPCSCRAVAGLRVSTAELAGLCVPRRFHHACAFCPRALPRCPPCGHCLFCACVLLASRVPCCELLPPPPSFAYLSRLTAAVVVATCSVPFFRRCLFVGRPPSFLPSFLLSFLPSERGTCTVAPRISAR